MYKNLRILYAAGPGNVIGTYQYWIQGEDDPSQVSVTYSSQFYDVCRDLDAQAYVISSHRDRQLLHDGKFTIEHRPFPIPKASGLLYHLVNFWYGLGIIISAVRFQANVIVVADGTAHWFLFSLLPWLGIKVIPSLHCVLWCKYLPQSKINRLFLKLSHHLFARQSTAIMVASSDIEKQIVQITTNQHQPIVEFLPLYRRSEFARVGKPDEKHLPFRVLFAGRIEPNKGVFELLEIAKSFQSQGRQDIVFDICGNGSALEDLCLAVEKANINSLFVCHGHCNKAQMQEMFNQAHVVIVPTKTNFVEGFNQVVAESILSGRPVITSAVCPALSYVREGVVEVPPDDIKRYGDALLKLSHDLHFYKQKQQACLGLQEQFYDVFQSWGAKLKSIIMDIQDSK
ncbi:MAG: glycosyltransferase family 4 protein [Calothrix sp. MO_167.B12]|nr:glycosyltransferase family 4 protein [Calothrix sp. MO_167.B12]